MTCSSGNFPSPTRSNLALKWLLVSEYLRANARLRALGWQLPGWLSPAIWTTLLRKNPFPPSFRPVTFLTLVPEEKKKSSGLKYYYLQPLHIICCLQQETNYLIPKPSSCGVGRDWGGPTHCLGFFYDPRYRKGKCLIKRLFNEPLLTVSGSSEITAPLESTPLLSETKKRRQLVKIKGRL